MRWQRIVFSVTVTEGLLAEVSEKRKGCGRKAIPPSLRQKSLVNKKGRYIANKRNKGTVCALPSIHLTFGKGGKCDGAEQGDYCPFTMIAGMARVDATGGASPSPYEKREG